MAAKNITTNNLRFKHQLSSVNPLPSLLLKLRLRPLCLTYTPETTTSLQSEWPCYVSTFLTETCRVNLNQSLSLSFQHHYSIPHTFLFSITIFICSNRRRSASRLLAKSPFDYAINTSFHPLPKWEDQRETNHAAHLFRSVHLEFTNTAISRTYRVL